MNDSADTDGQLQGRIAVITGASRGIGRSIATAFGKQGAHLILIARTSGALEEVDDEIRSAGGSATLVPLDLHDFEAIDRLGASIYERWGKLDILIGNAGTLGTLSPLGHIDPKEWQRVLDLNLTVNWRLIRSLDPLLRQSDAGRAVFVSSGVAQSHKAYWGTYAVSKAGLEALARIYAHENENSSINCNLVNPGAMRTNMRAAAMPGEDPMHLPHPDEVAPLFLELARADCQKNGEIISFREWQVETS